MLPIAKIVFRHHFIEHHHEQNVPLPNSQRVLYLYRVIGQSTSKAIQICRQCADGASSPPVVALTVEGLKSVGEPQIAICMAIKQTCGDRKWNFHLCGVTDMNRKHLTDVGLLEGLGRQNMHASIAALLQGSLAASPTERVRELSRPKFPSPTAPFAAFVPATPIKPPL